MKVNDFDAATRRSKQLAKNEAIRQANKQKLVKLADGTIPRLPHIGFQIMKRRAARER